MDKPRPLRPERTSRGGLRSLFLCGSALAPIVGFAAPSLADGPTTEFVVGGQVVAPRTFRLSDLQALPAQTQTVTFLNGNSSTTTTFTGPTLWSLLNDTVGLRLNPAVRNDVLRGAVIATGSDGYQAVYATGELNPSFGGNPARPELVAYASTPGRPLTSDGFARTTEPGDIRGGRYVSNVESIAVLRAPQMTRAFSGGLSTQFTVTGQVNAAATFDLARLTALGATTVSAPAAGGSPAATFTGVPLWTLLQTVGVTTNPAVRNNVLRDFVIATGSDGYQSTVSLGEINPDFGGNTANPVLVAYATNGGAPGTSLGTNGFARLVLPDDNLRGRWVSNLINLEVFDVSQWKVLAGESLDVAGFSYRTLGFTLAGGTLTSSLGPATLTAPTYILNGGVIDANVTLGGSGALTQASGTTLLRGSVATPNVAITGGALQLGADERLSSATVLAMSGGRFDLNGFAQTLAALNGAGTVSLSSASAGGQLTVGAGTFDGTIVDGGRPGALVKNGDGALTLTGTSTFSGPTNVIGGRLAVNGSLAGSPVIVGPSGSLGGAGTVGGVFALAGGTVAPGNSIGTLNVAGNVGFAPGSTYQVEANAAGQADRIAVTGAATLSGGTVQVLAQDGNYAPRTLYPILNAGGGVAGAFAGVTANLAFLTPTLRYAANEVDLTLTRNDVPFAAIAQTRNQIAVANGIQAAGPGSAIYARTVGLTTPEAVGAFQALSGDIHASAVSTSYETAFFVREAILDRLRWGGLSGGFGRDYGSLPSTYTADLPGRSAPVAPVPARVVDTQVLSLWGQGFGAFGHARSDGNAASVNRDLAGFVIGGDARLEAGFRLGAAGGYTSSYLETPNRLQSATIDSPFGAVYGGYEGGPVSVRAGAVYADNGLRVRRAVTFAGFSENERTRTGGSTVQGFGEVGYRFFFGGPAPVPALVTKGPAPVLAPAVLSYVEPFVGGAYVSIDRDRFSEFGGAAALTGAARTQDIPTLTAGVRAQTGLDLGFGAPVSLHGLLGYRRAFGDVVPTALLAFGAAPGFVTAGVPVSRDALMAEAGLDFRVSEATTLGVAYTGQVGTSRGTSSSQDHAVKGSLTYRF